MRALLERHRSWALVAAAGVAYVAGFHPINALVGPGAGALAVLPVIAAAWWLRPPTVIAISILAGGLLPLEYASVTNLDGADARTGLTTAAGLSLIGWVLVYARDSKRKIDRLLATDAATGLLNRPAFLRVLDAKLRSGDPPSSDLVIVDIRHFRQVAETFGQELGDEILRAVGRRLRQKAALDAHVARIGAVKFVIWLGAMTTPREAAQAVLAAVTEPVAVAGTQVRLEVQVAVARHPDHAATASELVLRVELALEEAKAKGRSTMIATARNEEDRLSRLETFAGLRTAIAAGELRLHYQPIVDLPSTAFRGVEALVRWQHPRRGLLLPGEFIQVAEQSGLIVPLTNWVLHEALRQSREWSDASRPIRIAVNVGAKALSKSALLAETVGELLGSYGVDPELLALEITETDVMTDPDHAIHCLTRLKALGIRTEIDDFGTGQSSLAYLQKLPLDAVKIDRSFITPLYSDAGTSAIVRAAIELSHALGLETIAEGVEDRPVVDMLAAMGCDFAQGYVFARPMPAADVVAWIDARSEMTVPAGKLIALPTMIRAGTTGGTVLVVDDEHPFRISAHRILTSQGYRVLHAATASEALRLCATHHGEIDLVLTDVYLTDWDGPKLAAHLRALYPELRVMFMSGDPRGDRRAGSDPFLAKPFSRQQLVTGVAGALAS